MLRGGGGGGRRGVVMRCSGGVGVGVGGDAVGKVGVVLAGMVGYRVVV